MPSGSTYYQPSLGKPPSATRREECLHFQRRMMDWAFLYPQFWRPTSLKPHPSSLSRLCPFLHSNTLRVLCLQTKLVASTPFRCIKERRPVNITGKTAGRSESPEANTSSCPPEITGTGLRKGSICMAADSSNWGTWVSLHKQAFRDALCVRYGWEPTRLPSHCSCGAQFTTAHAFSCSKGAFPSIRHNQIRDVTAQLLSEVCLNVEVEPSLQLLTRERLL